MIQSQRLTDELNNKKGYKTSAGKAKALRSIARTHRKSNPDLALEAQAMVDYLEKQQTDERFALYLAEYARIVNTKPSMLTRAQIKAQRQKFDTEEASK